MKKVYIFQILDESCYPAQTFVSIYRQQYIHTNLINFSYEIFSNIIYKIEDSMKETI
jgi:uncharacterized membrane protein YesL